MSYLTIAQLQHDIPDSPEAALKAAEQACAEAKLQGADMLALPEMFCCPYISHLFRERAEPEGGKTWSGCAEIAAKYGIYLSAGSVPEVDEQGHVYNTAYVFDDAGRQIAKHRKIHMFDIDVPGGQHFRESKTLSPGNKITTFDTPFCTFGICICYDIRFPELGRLMALRGAQVILVPASFSYATGKDHWELTLRSQALNHQVFTVGTAAARQEGAKFQTWSHSIVCDPWGRVVSMLDEAPAMAVTRLDLSMIQSVRDQLPLLKHRRQDVYRLEEL